MFLCEACVLYDMCRLSHLLSSLACRLAPQASGAFLSGAFAFENVPEEISKPVLFWLYSAIFDCFDDNDRISRG